MLFINSCADTFLQIRLYLIIRLNFGLPLRLVTLRKQLHCLTRYMAVVSSHDVSKLSQIFFAQLVVDWCNSHNLSHHLIWDARRQMPKHHLSTYVFVTFARLSSFLVMGAYCSGVDYHEIDFSREIDFSGR